MSSKGVGTVETERNTCRPREPSYLSFCTLLRYTVTDEGSPPPKSGLYTGKDYYDVDLLHANNFAGGGAPRINGEMYAHAQADASCRVGFGSVQFGFIAPFFVFRNLLEKCRAHIAPCVARDTPLPAPTSPAPQPNPKASHPRTLPHLFNFPAHAPCTRRPMGSAVRLEGTCFLANTPIRRTIEGV